MSNPFQDSFQEKSIDQFDSSLPVCFTKILSTYHNQRCQQSDVSSPNTIIDIERMTQRFSNTQVKNEDFKASLQQARKMLRQLKNYGESLLQRNIQIVLQLQHQKMKNKQLLSSLNLIKSLEQGQKAIFQQKLVNFNENNHKFIVEKNRNQILEHEVNTLRIQNNYLKQLILIANKNYETLQCNNKQLISRCTEIQHDYNKKQLEMLKKSEEIKSMFTTFMLEKNHIENQNRLPLQEKEQTNNINFVTGNATINLNCNKSIRKEPFQEAYRQIFIRTLKSKKQFKS